LGNKIISMSDTIYAEGFNVYEPRKEAPDWVTGNVVVRVEEFVKFLEEHKSEKGEVRFPRAPRKAGGYNLLFDTFVPDPSKGKKKEEVEESPF